MLAAARESLATLRRAGAKVFIYMDGSPSCGVYRTTLRMQSMKKYKLEDTSHDNQE
jgi:uncharacterized protein YbbK (DUF523 family)